MKKYWQDVNHKRHQRYSRKRSFRRKLEFKRYRKAKNSILNDTFAVQSVSLSEIDLKFADVIAPKIFSFKDNPEQVIQFICRLEEKYGKRKRVRVNLAHIEVIRYDAVVVLLSIMIQFKAAGIQFKGVYPNKKEVHQSLIKSGFYKTLDDYSIKRQESYKISARKEVFTQANKFPIGKFIMNTIHQSSLFIFGEKRNFKGAFRVLVEASQNTHNHAVREMEGQKHGWLLVHNDFKNKKVGFSFLDYGVGIFKSLRNKPIESKWYRGVEKLMIKFGYQNNCGLFRLILKGELHKTVTGEPHRGKGLPGMYECYERKLIDNLIIISNDVYVNAPRDEFKPLKSNFSGTFIYFEIDENVISHKLKF